MYICFTLGKRMELLVKAFQLSNLHKLAVSKVAGARGLASQPVSASAKETDAIPVSAWCLSLWPCVCDLPRGSAPELCWYPARSGLLPCEESGLVPPWAVGTILGPRAAAASSALSAAGMESGCSSAWESRLILSGIWMPKSIRVSWEISAQIYAGIVWKSFKIKYQ